MDGTQLFPPFTIHEADFALYLSDRDLALEPMGPVFLGGRLEDLSPELSFTKMPLSRQGDPFGTIFHADEEHRFTIGNLWVLERGSNFLPRVGRNQQYIFVVRWQDPETLAWAKRSYYGVTADGQGLNVAEQTFHQKIAFTARYLDERSGQGAMPNLSPTLSAGVHYASARERALLYLYDFGTGVFAPAVEGITDGRAAIVIDGSSWELQFEAEVPSLRITEDGVEASVISAIGGSFALGAVYPRVEFWSGPMRLGCVTAAGEFAAPSITVADDEPTLPGRLLRVEVNNAWAFSLGRGGAWAPGFSDTLT